MVVAELPFALPNYRGMVRSSPEARFHELLLALCDLCFCRNCVVCDELLQQMRDLASCQVTAKTVLAEFGLPEDSMQARTLAQECMTQRQLDCEGANKVNKSFE